MATEAQFSGLANASITASVAGGLLAQVGAFYKTKSLEKQYEIEALNLDIQQWATNVNARREENFANQLRQVRQYNLEITGSRAASEMGVIETMQGASGFRMSSASQEELRQSKRMQIRSERRTISSNSMAQISARMQRVSDLQAAARAQGVSAQNLRATAGGLNATSAAFAAGLSTSANTLQLAALSYGRR